MQSANFNKYSVGMKQELQLSRKYVSNQLLIADNYIKSNEYEKVEYIYNRLI